MGALGYSEPTAVEVGIFGFAALVMVIVCINSYRRGVVRLKRAVYRREESRWGFRWGLFLQVVGAMIVVGLFVLVLMVYLGWLHTRWA